VSDCVLVGLKWLQVK